MEEKKEVKQRKNKKTKQVGNGEMLPYYSERLGCWVYQYYDTSHKRQTMKQRKKETVKDFKARVTEVKNSLNNGTYISKSNDTFISILENFVEQKYKDGLVSTCTYNRDLQTIAQIKKVCINFFEKPIQKITVLDIEKSKEKMRDYSNSVIDKIWILLNKTFKIAMSRKMMSWNIMDDIALSKPISKKATKIIEALTIKEQEHFINILNTYEKGHKYRNILLLQLYTGMRIGEVLALSVSDIDFNNNIIHINKSLTRDENERLILGEHTKTYNRKTYIDKGERDFPITNVVKDILDNILSNNMTNIKNMLFWDYKNNSIIVPVEINSYLGRINNKYKISSRNLTSHVLRHTFITRCREKGVDFSVIQKIVGHTQGSSITNEIYTSISESFIQQELLKTY